MNQKYLSEPPPITMTTKEQCIELIRKAVPESQKSQFGCRIKPYNSHGYYNMIGGDWLSFHDHRGIFEEIDKITGLHDYEYETIGRPLTLQDVLIAFEKSGEDSEIGEVIDGSLMMYTEDYTGEHFERDSIGHYNLHKDVENQEEEFYEFLLPLLS